MIAFGLAFWLAAALFIRLAPGVVFDRGLGTALLYAGTEPVAWASVQFAGRLATLTPGQALPAVAIGSAAALLCDRVRLLWWPIYRAADRLPGGAWLLWGVGLSLIAGYRDDRRLAL